MHRALGALRRADLVDQGGEGRYQLSFGFLRLAFAYYDKLDEVARLRPALAALAEAFEETAHYAVLQGGEVMYVGKVQAANARIQMSSVVGGRNPAHCTGVGKAMLAYHLSDLRAVVEYVDRHGPLERRTAATLVSAKGLAADLAKTRERGFAIDNEESEAGINCLAFPLFLTGRSTPDGAISITALAQRYPTDKLSALAGEAQAIVIEHLGGVLP